VQSETAAASGTATAEPPKVCAAPNYVSSCPLLSNAYPYCSSVDASDTFAAADGLSQGFIVLVTAQIGAGQMPKFQELFAPLVSHIRRISCSNTTAAVEWCMFKYGARFQSESSSMPLAGEAQPT
jgi:hypothetical protein